MTNNKVLRRIRYCFDYKDAKMIQIFAGADSKVTKEQVCSWLKQDEDEGFQNCPDPIMAQFLDGLIIEKRGKEDGIKRASEKKLNNNIIFRKLKIALNLKSDDVIEILKLADFKISKHELSAFFRKPDNKHYRSCKDQILRNFLEGLQIKFRGVE